MTPSKKTKSNGLAGVGGLWFNKTKAGEEMFGMSIDFTKVSDLITDLGLDPSRVRVIALGNGYAEADRAAGKEAADMKLYISTDTNEKPATAPARSARKTTTKLPY